MDLHGIHLERREFQLDDSAVTKIKNLMRRAKQVGENGPSRTSRQKCLALVARAQMVSAHQLLEQVPPESDMRDVRVQEGPERKRAKYDAANEKTDEDVDDEDDDDDEQHSGDEGSIDDIVAEVADLEGHPEDATSAIPSDEHSANENHADAEEEDVVPQKMMNRSQWLAALRSCDTQTLRSPRTDAILDLLTHIQQTWPGERTLVLSQSPRFLDIVELAMQHHPRHALNPVTRFARTLSSEEWKSQLQRFTSADVQHDGAVLLVTAGSGLTGIHVSAATKVIQAEPAWNNDEMQAYATCCREQEKKDVHCWVMRATNSLVDKHFCQIASGKEVHDDDLVTALRRLPDECPDIPYIHRWGIAAQPTAQFPLHPQTTEDADHDATNEDRD